MSKENYRAYEQVRRQIFDGDLLLCRPHGLLLSQAIAAGGRSKYSHAAIAARWGETLMVLEMSYSGGRAVTLSSQVAQAPGCWDVYRTNPNCLPFDRGQMVETMIRAMGTPYGWGNFFKLCWRKLPFVRFLVRPITDDRINGTPLICSQAVSRACRLAGYDPVPELSDSLTEPGDLARSPFFKYRFTLV